MFVVVAPSCASPSRNRHKLGPTRRDGQHHGVPNLSKYSRERRRIRRFHPHQTQGRGWTSAVLDHDSSRHPASEISSSKLVGRVFHVTL